MRKLIAMLRAHPEPGVILVPIIERDREVYVNDLSVEVTLSVTWLFRSLNVSYSRPLARRDRRPWDRRS